MQTSPTTEAGRSSRGLDCVNFFVATDSPWIGRRRLGLLPLQGPIYAVLPGPYAPVICHR
jgi:hypothetical protein